MLLCVTILLVTSTVRAQTELEKKTLALVNEIASAAWGLKAPENRVFIMASTADLLWSFDEKRARNLYWEALNTINSIGTANLKSGDREDQAGLFPDIEVEADSIAGGCASRFSTGPRYVASVKTSSAAGPG